jgi:hypothetical protein
MYFRKKTSGGRAYLQIVENRREGVAVRQQVIATLGRVEDLRMSGQLERLLRSGARFAAKAIVVDAVDAGEATTSATRRIGAALVFERLWEETGCRKVVEDLAGARKHDFALERAVFLTVLHRLFPGGSDRAADRWREDYRIEGVEGLDLQPIERGVKFVLVDLAPAEFDPSLAIARTGSCALAVANLEAAAVSRLRIRDRRGRLKFQEPQALCVLPPTT